MRIADENVVFEIRPEKRHSFFVTPVQRNAAAAFRSDFSDHFAAVEASIA